MTVSHSVAIDRAGRLVIPKPVRDALGIEPGQPLRISARDGVIEIEPLPLLADLVDVDGVAVITPREPVPAITRETVRDLIDAGRR